MEKDDDGNARQLPSGLITFVFTDIEGSTRLYKSLGEDRAAEVFDLHNAILRAAWEAHRGHEVHTEGDSFFVVFEDATDAVAASVEVQEGLAAAAWPEEGEVRVRIGIHCGLAAPRNDDYMALAVHQAARVMAAANGGQILATATVLERVSAIDGVSFTTAGAFRLRDFDEAPTLHRVDSESFAANERPPRAVPASHHNLVPPLTSFVGRASDVVTVNALLEPARVVTIVGPGGMGKTRLATAVGIEVAPAWPSGVRMVELAEIADPELVADKVAATIGVAAAGVGDRWHDVVEHIGDNALLLILDNVEHLIEPIAELVPVLLRACPNLVVLATSREPLNCPGETIYRLQPLDISTEAQRPVEAPSVELFIDRARAVSPNFEWNDDAIAEVIEICRHLDGLPLAIEIAAAQVAVLTLSEIRAGLDNRFRLLRSRDRALPARQRTMEGLLGWSYHLLSDAEQRALRRLGVFGGSFSIDAAEAAIAGDDLEADDVPELIWSLVDKSLVTADLSDSATRYRLLESVQHYAMGLLIDTDDAVRSASALGLWLRERIGPWKPNDRTWLGEVSLELANIRTVVELVSSVDDELGQQLMCSVGRYRDSVQSYRAGVDELTWAADLLRTPTPSRVALLSELADLHLRMANSDAARHVLAEAEQLEARVGPPDWNDVAVARSLGEVATRAGEFSEAITVAEQTLARDLSPRGASRMWSLLGIAQCSAGDLDAGLVSLERCLQIYIELEDAPAIAVGHGNVAEAAWRSGDTAKAALHQRECLEDGLAIGQQVAIAHSLIMAAHLARLREEWTVAVPLYHFGEELLTTAGHQLYADEQEVITQTIDRATSVLGGDAIDALTGHAQAMTLIDATAVARRIFDEATSTLSKP